MKSESWYSNAASRPLSGQISNLPSSKHTYGPADGLPKNHQIKSPAPSLCGINAGHTLEHVALTGAVVGSQRPPILYSQISNEAFLLLDQDDRNDTQREKNLGFRLSGNEADERI
jgi:hypothetical protein